jgi:hypothetical protein
MSAEQEGMKTVIEAETAATRSAASDSALKSKSNASTGWHKMDLWSSTGDGKENTPSKASSTELEKKERDGKR